MVLIKAMNELHIFKSPELFPSPCGDYGSYLRAEINLKSRWSQGFRPLAGIMVLIQIIDEYCSSHDTYCFRPLAGIMVLIIQANTDVEI